MRNVVIQLLQGSHGNMKGLIAVNFHVTKYMQQEYFQTGHIQIE